MLDLRRRCIVENKKLMRMRIDKKTNDKRQNKKEKIISLKIKKL